MYKICDLVQGSDEWLKWRKSGVTATCTPILNPDVPNHLNKTPYQLYLEYIGAIKPADLSKIKQVEVGQISEQFARHWFEKKIGLISSPCCVQNNTHPFIIASLDGLTEQGDVVEFKNLTDKNHTLLLTEQKDSTVFNYYKWQVFHQMVAVGAKRGFLFFWSPKNTPIVFQLKLTTKIVAEVVRLTQDFWQCVTTKKAPAFDVNKDVIYLNSPEALAERNIDVSPNDIQSHIKKLEQLQKDHLAVSAELKKIKSTIESLNEQITSEVSVLSSILKLPPNAPIRIEGYGVRYLETDMSPRFSWRGVGKKLGIEEKDHPDCYGEPIRRLSISSYIYNDQSPESVTSSPACDSDSDECLDFMDIYEYI